MGRGEKRGRTDGRDTLANFISWLGPTTKMKLALLLLLSLTPPCTPEIYYTRGRRGSGCFHRCRELLCHYAMSGTGHDDIFFQWR